MNNPPAHAIASISFGSTYADVAALVGAFLLFVLLSYLVHFILDRVADSLKRKQRAEVIEHLIQATYRPITLFFLVQGILAVAVLLSQMERWHGVIGLDAWLNIIFRGWAVLTLLLVAAGGARALGVVLTWYGENLADDEGAILAPSLINPLRRFATLGIYIIAILLALELVGISVTPLVAGLGIGGLAVALAVQPTLSNFFAGSYLSGDRVISAGDFVELENGFQGYVVDVGWRSTRLRTPYNNLVVVPNSRLADSMLTNYSSPEEQIGVLVMCGVSYSSALADVERMAKEAAQKVVDNTDGADKGMAPWFGFETFGDSNIDFWVWVQANSRIDSFIVKSELIKALHERFGAEGISINYPMRHLVFPEDGLPVTHTEGDGPSA
ncbi:MAG: mechanosensitive ion channel family protein [Chloroflexi bacterium]|nr:mechanosensitive ion channel family protein [Chloroflexota bacterium]